MSHITEVLWKVPLSLCVVPAIWDRKKGESDSDREMTGNFQSPLLWPRYLTSSVFHQKIQIMALTAVRSLSWLMFLEVWEKVQSILILSRAEKGR